MTPHRRHARNPGFTLIEVLVTLFVIAVIAGIAVVRFGNDDGDELVRREALRLLQVIELAREEAVLGGDEWGLALTDERYRFLRLDRTENRWREMRERPFEVHDMPDRLSLRLTLADRGRIGGQDTSIVTRDRSGPRPALLLLSSGEMTPFSLLLSSLDTAAPVRLTSDGFGRVRLDADADAGPGT